MLLIRLTYLYTSSASLRLINIESRELIFSINVNSIIKELTLNCFADYCENEFHVCGQDHVLKNKITYHIVI